IIIIGSSATSLPSWLLNHGPSTSILSPEINTKLPRVATSSSLSKLPSGWEVPQSDFTAGGRKAFTSQKSATRLQTATMQSVQSIILQHWPPVISSLLSTLPPEKARK
ncbi:hypothetical protein, partial [Klebsiella pneumoniae]|uniref:hypothetical protein n=1 Tax=Klebsiella pneumoniae TaxID=573 RepID=UPI001C12AED9